MHKILYENFHNINDPFPLKTTPCGIYYVRFIELIYSLFLNGWTGERQASKLYLQSAAGVLEMDGAKYGGGFEAMTLCVYNAHWHNAKNGMSWSKHIIIIISKPFFLLKTHTYRTRILNIIILYLVPSSVTKTILKRSTFRMCCAG